LPRAEDIWVNHHRQHKIGEDSCGRVNSSSVQYTCRAFDVILVEGAAVPSSIAFLTVSKGSESILLTLGRIAYALRLNEAPGIHVGRYLTIEESVVYQFDEMDVRYITHVQGKSQQVRLNCLPWW